MKMSHKEFIYQYDIKIEKKNSLQDAICIKYHYAFGSPIKIQLNVVVTFLC